MGRSNGHVPHVGSQVRQLARDVDALLVPAVQCRDGEAVPQVVQPRRPASLIHDPGRQAQQLPVVRQTVRTVRDLVPRVGVAGEQRAAGSSGLRRSAR